MNAHQRRKRVASQEADGIVKNVGDEKMRSVTRDCTGARKNYRQAGAGISASVNDLRYVAGIRCNSIEVKAFRWSEGYCKRIERAAAAVTPRVP